MDPERAATLLSEERQRVEQALQDLRQEGSESRSSATEGAGDIADPAEPLTDEEADDAVAQQLRDRLAAIGRAEDRLKAGTFGRSLKSGQPIPDERLEADPAAELTAEEATAQ
jgi:RNA polymerase-binding transcription factor